MTSWYSIKNSLGDVSEVYVYDDIGEGGISGEQFAKDFSRLRGDVTIRINSSGGDVFAGTTMYNAIKRSPARTTSIVDGLAASAASFVAIAAKRVLMAPGSMMMIHEASSMVAGDAATLEERAAVLHKASDIIAAMYVERAGGSVEQWRERMRKESWFSDKEAVEIGLADAIDAEPDAKRMWARYFDNQAKMASAQLVKELEDVDLPALIAASASNAFREAFGKRRPAPSKPIDWRKFMEEQAYAAAIEELIASN